MRTHVRGVPLGVVGMGGPTVVLVLDGHVASPVPPVPRLSLGGARTLRPWPDGQYAGQRRGWSCWDARQERPACYQQSDGDAEYCSTAQSMEDDTASSFGALTLVHGTNASV